MLYVLYISRSLLIIPYCFILHLSEYYIYVSVCVFRFIADIIHGKLFQNNRFLEIDYAQGRDIPPGYTTKIAKTLQDWVDSCDAISNCIVEQIKHANAEKSKKLDNKKQIEQKVRQKKKMVRKKW